MKAFFIAATVSILTSTMGSPKSHAEVPDDVRGSAPSNSGPGIHARCLIVLKGHVEYRGLCTLIRKANDNVTEIDGDDIPHAEGDYDRYFIVRDDINSSTAVFKRKFGDKPAETLGDIMSAGNCWRGLRVTFCAE